MANLTLLRNAGGRVIGIGRSLVILQVARHARCSRQVVVSVDVAQRALHLDVRASQRKRGLRMIERCRLPGRGGVAHFALLRNARSQMVRAGRTLVVLQVAGDACRGRQVEISAGMALVALQLRMPARERKPDRIVVETRRLPGRRRMALLAGLRKAESQVVGIARLLEIRQVAAHACRRRALVLPPRMASGAVQRRVHSGQGEAREFQVVKIRT